MGDEQLEASAGVAAHTAAAVCVIGRNEGERLQRCLRSLLDSSNTIVYVDSGSTDNSVELTRTLGVEVLELDPTIPFTAARARNTGFRRILELTPKVEYVFFVDGDCEVADQWLEKATDFLHSRPDVAIVWGLQRERYPQNSLYNLLCDLEWRSVPAGETRICGGNAVVRVKAFAQAEGYRSDLICGEEPELCVRLRKAGWRVWHLDADMIRHDAALLHFSQWWTRMLRGGYAYAQGVALHGAGPERHWVSEWQRAWFWGLWLPLLTIVATALSGFWGLGLLLLYPLQITRLAVRGPHSVRENWWRAAALVISKFPEALGQLKFMRDRLRRRQSRIIEYK